MISPDRLLLASVVQIPGEVAVDVVTEACPVAGYHLDRTKNIFIEPVATRFPSHAFLPIDTNSPSLMTTRTASGSLALSAATYLPMRLSPFPPRLLASSAQVRSEPRIPSWCTPPQRTRRPIWTQAQTHWHSKFGRPLRDVRQASQ